MTDLNLSNMPLKDLKKLQAQVTRAIATFEQRKKDEARAVIESKARELGFSLADLSSGRQSISVPKYQHPKDPSRTWTGRGRKPRWFLEALAAGFSPDDMLIA